MAAAGQDSLEGSREWNWECDSAAMRQCNNENRSCAALLRPQHTAGGAAGKWVAYDHLPMLCASMATALREHGYGSARAWLLSLRFRSQFLCEAVEELDTLSHFVHVV